MLNAYEKVQVWVHSTNQHGKRVILLLKTIPSRGGSWQPITGSVEKKETPVQAALREATEETGLDYSSVPQPLGYEFEFKSRFGLAKEYVFELQAPLDRLQPGISIKLDPREHTASQWIEPSLAFSLLPYENQQESLRRLLVFWEQNIDADLVRKKT